MIFKRSRNNGSGPTVPSPPPQPQKKETQKSASSGPSIIGPDMLIEGTIQSTGEVHVDGTVHGNISATVVIVDVNGTVHGHIVAEDVWIRGRVIGPVNGMHVTIVANAHVEGDILNQTIAIENGAFIDGRIHRVDDPLNMIAAEPQYLPSYDQHHAAAYEDYPYEVSPDQAQPAPGSKAAE